MLILLRYTANVDYLGLFLGGSPDVIYFYCLSDYKMELPTGTMTFQKEFFFLFFSFYNRLLYIYTKNLLMLTCKYIYYAFLKKS